MRQLEINIFNKLKKDFPTEVEALEQGIDLLFMYIEQIKELSLNKRDTDTVEDLLNAS